MQNHVSAYKEYNHCRDFLKYQSLSIIIYYYIYIILIKYWKLQAISQ